MSIKKIAALLFLGLFSCFIFQNCSPSNGQLPPNEAIGKMKKIALPEVPKNYWFQGKAEITRYKVEQERYGQMREAQQVMVFVTEDFSEKKQVKLDDPTAAGTDRVPILKVNVVRRFVTGIYDYSLMLSVFTPFEQGKISHSLKTTTTIQDWCGHIFSQFNRTDGGFLVQNFSYFEKEGDQKIELKTDFLEDEIWTMLRLRPEIFSKLKTSVVPATFYNRLRHKDLKAESANFSIKKDGKNSTLILKFENIERQVSVNFETDFPHRILGWEETVDGKLASRGTLENVSMQEYWKENSTEFENLRDTVGLKWF